ncbi:hypothetical protein ACCO45_012714 [Purpureocillium lilacinum]|uniref:Uncharacterized protein n=1 Tax=Purpureocillium lilacinum TaxID=33203 RepID=A0ACC4D8S6_PURLI
MQPCLCILAGEGHTSKLLTVAFHDTGRYLLSAGHDQAISLWTVPSLPTQAIDTPFQVHYPHFSTTAVHSGIVDCVSFYGDQVLSRACYDNAIVLWRIEGFSSTDPPPRYSEAPTPQAVISTSSEGQGGFTRSAFVPAMSPGSPTQYTRLLEFHTPRCAEQFFMRFKLHHVPGQHAVLAFCNAAGSIFFWDFARLTAYREVMERLRKPRQDKNTEHLPSWLSLTSPSMLSQRPTIQFGDNGVVDNEIQHGGSPEPAGGAQDRIVAG